MPFFFIMNKIEKIVNTKKEHLLKGNMKMADLNQMELQNLKKLINIHEMIYQKLNAYSAQAVDPQIKQVFIKAAQENLNTKQKLISFLND